MMMMMNARTVPPASRDQRLVEAVLVNAGLFKGLAHAQVASLARQCWTIGASRGDVIAPRGRRLPGVLTIAYGSIKLSLRAPEGGERVLRLAAAGESFGEASALSGRVFPCEAQALCDSRLVVVPTAAVVALIERDARAARRVLDALAERNLALLDELQSSSLRRGSERLASFLDSLVGDAAAGNACTVRLPASKTVIASRLNMKKETLSRLLRELSEQGLIRVAQRDIALLDRERLLRPWPRQAASAVLGEDEKLVEPAEVSPLA